MAPVGVAPVGDTAAAGLCIADENPKIRNISLYLSDIIFI